jgi:cytochrome c oxidase subunit 7c
MFAARSVARLPATAARRGFHTTPRQMGSPYHYPEGPRSNIPFNPMTRFFALRYWGFMGTWAQKRETRIQEALDRETDNWNSRWLRCTFRHCW